MRTLPTEGAPSTRYPHLGLWVYSLGPHSPVPGDRLRLAILDEFGDPVRKFEQVMGSCIDPGYVDFFMSHNCRPAVHEVPIVDIDEDGKIVSVLHPNYTQNLGMQPYLDLLKVWVEKNGKEEYALTPEEIEEWKVAKRGP